MYRLILIFKGIHLDCKPTMLIGKGYSAQ